MTEAAATTTETTKAPASEAQDGSAFVDAVRTTFGDDAAEAVGGKPLTKPEPEAEAEAKEPPAASPEQERVAKRILAAQKAEMRAAQQRREIEQARAELAKQQEALKEHLALVEQAKAAKASPSKLLELSGLSPKEFLETLAHEHEPDKVAERVANGVKSEVDKLREELAALRKEREAEAARAKQAEIDAATKETEKEFVNFVLEKADDYPHIQTWTERALVRRSWELLSEVVGYDDAGKPVTNNEAFFARNGRFPTDEEIATALNALAEQEAAETLSARRARLANTAQKPGEGETTGVMRAAPQDSRGQSPRTLTARAASTRATAKRELTQEEMDEESMRILRSLSRS